MNILVPYSWLKDFLKTSASPKKISDALSLCSQSVEKIHRAKDDSVLEIEIAVNRYDCLSIIGIGREAAAALPMFGIKAEFIPPKIPPLPKVKNPKYDLEVTIKDKDVCPRFSAIVIDKVKIGPSLRWMAERLEKVGIRPLSNVVDISNYLMMETGQPIHSFDYDKILGAKMVMRLSRAGEKITTLDGVIRTLPGGDIVIEDGKGRLIDLCGIMGAENSQIDENTKRVLFFVQAYNPTRVRQTSILLGHRTEAAARFEKGIDLEGIIPVVAQGVKLMKDLAGGVAASKLIDIYPEPQKRSVVNLDYDFLESRLGVKLPTDKVKKILVSLGFEIIESNAISISVRTPAWRANDISIKEDLIEEVARIYGYYRLPSNIPSLDPKFGLRETPQPKKGEVEPFFTWENKTKDLLVSRGFSELYNFSFISQESIQKADLETVDHLKLKNPLTTELEFLRISLIPSLLEAVAKNQAEFDKIRIFELANVYLPVAENKLPNEEPMLAGAIMGSNFYEIKAIIEELLDDLGIMKVKFVPYQLKKTFYGKVFHPVRTAEIMIKNDSLGVVGETSPHILARFGIKGRVVVFDLDFSQLVKYATTAKKYTPIPKYPPIIEDLAFVVPARTLVGEIIEKIKKVSKLIVSVDLLDSYKDTRTFRLTYQSPKRTLSDKEIEKIRKKIIDKLAKSFDTKLKS